MYQDNELFGAMRSGSISLKRASHAAEESWEEEEVMMSPRRCAELNSLIRECENELKRIRAVSKKFGEVAVGRVATVV